MTDLESEQRALIGAKVLHFLSRELMEKYGDMPPWDLTKIEAEARALTDKYLVNFKTEQRPIVTIRRAGGALAIHVDWPKEEASDK